MKGQGHAGLIALLAFTSLTSPIGYGAERLTAPEAHTLLQQDILLLIDVREPAEWRATGIALGAKPLAMHDPEFVPKLRAFVTAAPGRKLAIICATGGRTRWLSGALASRGFDPPLEVDEGMVGNAEGPGWIARGLPVVDLDGSILNRSERNPESRWFHWPIWRKPEWAR